MNRMRKKSEHEGGSDPPEIDNVYGSSLFEMTKADAIEKMAGTLMEFRGYCRQNNLNFLGYLTEMALVEATNVRASE